MKGLINDDSATMGCIVVNAPKTLGYKDVAEAAQSNFLAAG